MGLYSRLIFPLLVDWALDRPEINELRRELLSGVEGGILEVGFGTGLNLPFYPPSIRKITVVDPNPGMKAKAQKRVKKSGIEVGFFTLKGEALPFSDEVFDSVVTTFTLCSIADLPQALGEIRRVLKPEGRFFFLEHGLSPDPKVGHWQHRLTPFQRVIGDGCHLDRDMERILLENRFRFLSLKKFHLQGFPKIAGFLSQGISQKEK